MRSIGDRAPSVLKFGYLIQQQMLLVFKHFVQAKIDARSQFTRYN
jgi:hypothetical protein